MLMLKNARVVPELMGEYQQETADVIVDCGVIQEVCHAGDGQCPSGAQTIDLAGKTLLPGLIDAHVHLDLCGMNTFEENVQPDAFRVVRALKLAQDNLRKGYTTLRDVGDRNNIIIDLSKAIKAGYAVAPTILASGVILSPTEAGNDFFGAMYREADSPAEWTKAVRRQWQLGADWIKYMGTGAVMNPGGEPGASIITEEELMAAVRAADAVGLPVCGHVHGTAAIKLAIRCGVRTVEHSTIMDDECIRMYLASDRTFMMPTIAPQTNFLEHPANHPAHYVEKSKRLHKIMCEGYRAAYEAGVKMGFATDAGVYAGGHGDGAYEFTGRYKYCGMAPKDLLIQATKNTAEILMIDKKVGTIEPGKAADIAIFNGRPDEDVACIRDVAMVLKNGVIVH